MVGRCYNRVHVANYTVHAQVMTIRVSREVRDLIDRAARVQEKSRSAFMLETVCREAENVLLDQRFFRLDDEAFSQFSATLDATPEPPAELRDLLRHEAPWE
jgi:uncharacterized protein (DUF1778 family)